MLFFLIKKEKKTGFFFFFLRELQLMRFFFNDYSYHKMAQTSLKKWEGFLDNNNS